MPDTPREQWDLDTRHVGRRVLVFERVESTNDVAASLACDATNAGTVVLTEYQTAGRGQYGRTWQSRPGTSLLLSVLLLPPAELRRPVVMTAWAAVSVAEAIYALTGVQARIKWPNDVLVRGKKVCGILIEQRLGVVVGIGLNLNQSADDFADADLPDATSLALVTGKPFDSREAAVILLRRLDDEYARLLDGDSSTLEAEWKWRVGLLGRHVVAELNDGSAVAGRLRDLTFDGVELEVEEGGVRAVVPEQVRHLRAV